MHYIISDSQFICVLSYLRQKKSFLSWHQFIFLFQIQLEITTIFGSHKERVLLRVSRRGQIKSRQLLMMARKGLSTRHPSSFKKVFAEHQDMFPLNQVHSLESSGDTLIAMSNFKTKPTMTSSSRTLAGEFQRAIAT